MSRAASCINLEFMDSRVCRNKKYQRMVWKSTGDLKGYEFLNTCVWMNFVSFLTSCFPRLFYDGIWVRVCVWYVCLVRRYRESHRWPRSLGMRLGFVMSSHDDDDFKRFYLRIEGAFVYRNEASMIKSDYLNSSTVNYYLGVRGDFGWLGDLLINLLRRLFVYYPLYKSVEKGANWMEDSKVEVMNRDNCGW